MKRTNFILAALLSTLFVPALAAESEGERQENRVVAREVREVRAFDANAFAGIGMRFAGRPVKNLPYTAEVITERVQNLADGNQITHKTTSMTYRDGAGRTRQEMRDPKGEVRHITIHDPVSGTTYILNPREKTATQIAPNKQLNAAAAEAARARIEALRKEGKLPEMRERREIIIRHAGDQGDDVKIEIDKAERMKIEGRHHMLLAPGGDLQVRLGALAGAFGDSKWSSKATTKDLGTRDIDGIKAEGKMRSYEIPAGEVGNRNAIVVSDETWFSPELQVTVLTKHSDPRTGDNIYRLGSIKREEPAASLFAVPSDYAVKDVMANVQRRIEKKAQ